MNQTSHVLIFDSGVGGLSVYQAIYAQYPDLTYSYLFDNEGYPYGELDSDILIDRVLRLIIAMVDKSKRDNQAIDLVVIACNTASTIVLPALREHLTIPVVGVVPAIKPAAKVTQKALALIATPATVKRPYTHDLIQQFAPDLELKLLGSTELVLMGEQKMRGEVIDMQALQKILSPIIGQIDVAILGCTHFPLLKTEIQQVLGDKVTLVDSGEAIAHRVGSLLNLDVDNQKVLNAQKMVNKQKDLLGKEKQAFAIYSSTTAEDEVALNNGVRNLGFKPVRLFPLPNALDH